MKDSFYEASSSSSSVICQDDSLFDTFRKYHTNILLGNFNAEVDREDISKPTGSESLQEFSNDNGAGGVNQIPRSIVHDVLHKRLHLRRYKIQMIHALKPSDQVARTNFAVDMLERTDASPDFVRQVCFSDEATFHVSGVVNRYNCRIWGSQNPHVTCELERGSPKLNVWTCLMRDKSIGTFFFSEKFVTGRSCLDMLQLHALKARTRDDLATVALNMLQETWNEVEYRLDICRATKGIHTEIYCELYTQTTGNTALLLIYTLDSSPLHTH
ncbi:hypothetical protein B7P43_G08217 [Cryptotermes secundus]|uniref:Uncharacterized protein n=1 Tax=Cryptotermes secundus TaxID=105785 RepID=A0A2J7PSC8_9NEOP|nr:hypothetical protein B7P43_G08217 [Cryptotermes secundus]